ncbi:hypothetical protein ACTD5D_21635 [Nocardia takedensis]|uniref:hypothetical protein n=1 Tax=Nocardia takedensis TaxID=259390 RepID=UPI003F774CB6
MSVAVPGHLAEVVRDAIIAAVPEAELIPARRSKLRTVTTATTDAPRTPRG